MLAGVHHIQVSTYCVPYTVVHLGCPRNNLIFFWFEPKQTETQSVSVVRENQKTFFSVCFGLIRFVSAFRIGIETTETNTTLSKQTEKSLKNVLY
jgi:hypothetical protein